MPVNCCAGPRPGSLDHPCHLTSRLPHPYIKYANFNNIQYCPFFVKLAKAVRERDLEQQLKQLTETETEAEERQPRLQLQLLYSYDKGTSLHN